MSLASSDNFTIGPVILAWPHLFQPQSVNGGKPTYNTTIVFDQATFELLNEQVVAIAHQAFPNGEYNQANFKWPLHRTEEKPTNFGQLPGRFFANIKSGGDKAEGKDYPPQVVDSQRQPILDPGQIKTNNEAYVSVNVYAFNHPLGGKGVSIGVSAVLKWSEGTPLIEGGGVDVNSAFANVPKAPPPGAQVPQGMAPPPGAAPVQPPRPAGLAPQGGVHPTTGQQVPPVTTPNQF